MSVILTSFKRFRQGPIELAGLDEEEPVVPDRAFSIAVYQPKGFNLPVLSTFDIRDDSGQWVRPRNFVPEGHTTLPDQRLLRRYHDALAQMYWDRRLDKGLWVLNKAWKEEEVVALCCWCPYDRAAQRQLRDYGSFVCHSWPVESTLIKWGMDVYRDRDREEMVG